MEARVADVDFAIDKYMLWGIKDQKMARLMDCKTAVRHLKNAIRLGVEKKLGECRIFCTQKNTGLEMGHRKAVGKSYKTKQFLKFYAKFLELLYNKKTKPFTDTYLCNKEMGYFDKRYFMRVETTLKDKAHFESYGIEGISTLSALLELDLEKQGKQFFERPIKKYFDGGKYQKVKREDYSPTDLYILGYMNLYCLTKKEDKNTPVTAEELECIIWPLIQETLPESMPRSNKCRERSRLTKLAKGFTKKEEQKLYNKKTDACNELGFLIR